MYIIKITGENLIKIGLNVCEISMNGFCFVSYFVHVHIIGFSFPETKTICFTPLSKNIALQAEIFQEKFSTRIIFIPCTLCVTL